MIPETPNGWIVRGDLPIFDVATNEELLEQLDEDLIQVVDSTRTFTLDVGWYPAANVDGHFLARAIMDDAWNVPIEEFESSNARSVLAWLEGWIVEIQFRMGHLDAIVEQAMVRSHLSLPRSPEPARDTERRNRPRTRGSTYSSHLVGPAAELANAA